MMLSKFCDGFLLKKCFKDQLKSVSFWIFFVFQIAWFGYYCFTEFTWEFTQTLNMGERVIDSLTSSFPKHYTLFIPFLFMIMNNRYLVRRDTLMVWRLGRTKFYNTRVAYVLLFCIIWSVIILTVSLLINAISSGNSSFEWSSTSFRTEEYIRVSYPFFSLNKTFSVPVVIIMAWALLLIQAVIYSVLSLVLNMFFIKRYYIPPIIMILVWGFAFYLTLISPYLGMSSYTDITFIYQAGTALQVCIIPLLLSAIFLLYYIGISAFYKRDLLGARHA